MANHTTHPNASKRYYFLQNPGLDLTLTRYTFDGLPPLTEARDEQERQQWIAFWKEALNCVLWMLGNRDEEIKEFHETPGEFEGWVFDNIVPVILQLHPSEDRQMFWKPILDLGTPAHHWIEDFLLGWFLYGLDPGQNESVFIQVWKKMLDFAFISPKWAYNPQRGSHELDDLWYRLMGIDRNFLHLWNEEKTTTVTQMRTYYERWAQLHLFHGYNTSAFLKFLQTPAAQNIRLDGLIWIDLAVFQMDREFQYEEPDRLAGLLTFCWQNHQIALRQHSGYWTAFKNLLARLVRQGDNRVFALSKRI